MKRRQALAAIVLALLVAAAGAGAYTGSQLVVGSIHTTDTDFQAGSTTNMTVSNDAVSLTSVDTTLTDGFEDGTSEWTTYQGSLSTTTSTVYNGLTAGVYSGTSSYQGGSMRTTVISSGNVTVSAWINDDDSGSTPGVSLRNSATGEQYFAAISTFNELNLYTVASDGSQTMTSTSVTIDANTWYRVELERDQDTGEMTAKVYDSNNSVIATQYKTDTTFTPDQAGINAYRNSPIYDDFSYSEGSSPSSGQYISSTFNVDNAQESRLNITDATNVSYNITPQYYDGSSWVNDSTTTYTSTGVMTIGLSSVTSSQWRMRVDVEKTGDNPKWTMADESIWFENDAPTLDNSTATPTGDLTQSSTTFEIDVSDSTFPLAQGDTVTAELYIDGTLKGSDTLTANGTASVSATISEGGDHTYHWELTDEYGGTATSQTFSINAPGTLEIHKETQPDQLVTDAQANITAYYGSEVLRRNTNDGTINLTDFPINQPIIVRVQADGYYTRTAVIESIYEQSNMYILNSSIATHEVRFDLQDSTGEYPASDTVLFIERDLNVSGNVSWEIISGDNFGIQGVPVNLAQDERYRIRIKNLETNTTAVLGSFTAIQSETVTLEPASPTLDVVESNKTYGWNITKIDSTQKIVLEYLDTENQTQSIKFTIHERFNNSNVLVNNETFTSNDLVYEKSLTANQTNLSWTAELYIDRGDGYKHYRVPIGGGPRDLIPGILDVVWRNASGVFIMLIVALAFSQLNVGVGAITTSLVGGILWYIGLLNDVATGPAVVLALGISLVYHYRTGGGQ